MRPPPTRRVTLRQWRPEDRAPFAALNADPEVMEHFPGLMTRADSDAFADRIVAHVETHGYGLWALEIDGVFAGYTGLQWATFAASFTPALEIGWRLARPFWGHGYVSEAATAVLADALAGGPGQEAGIVSFTAVTNVRSWRVMERIGMTRVGEFVHPRADLPERIRPHVLYRADAQTWRPHSVLD